MSPHPTTNSVNSKLSSFSFTRWPEIHYGPDVTCQLKGCLKEDLHTVLWVTGGEQGQFSTYFGKFLLNLEATVSSKRIVQITGEPSPAMIDAICDQYRSENICKVIAIGGGSVVDAGKAISAMLVSEASLFDYLEGVGKGIPLSGEKIPFIAVPTTSGTGSEMTANAVFREVGEQGYKKSVRHHNLVPDEVWIDPNLITTCSPLQTVCSGLDAFTQLLEPYLSTKANLISDTLAEKGLQLIIDNLELAFAEGGDDPEVRGSIALAAAFSGACLANAGLGIVHGIAGPLGGYFDIPHGVACAGLVAKANEVNHQALIARGDRFYLQKMARVGRMFGPLTDNHGAISAAAIPESGGVADNSTIERDCQLLTDHLMRWEALFELPKFSDYDVTDAAIPKVLRAASNRNNPVELYPEEIQSIIEHAL